MADLRAARSLEFFTTPRNSPSFPLSECYAGEKEERAAAARQQQAGSREDERHRRMLAASLHVATTFDINNNPKVYVFDFYMRNRRGQKRKDSRTPHHCK